MTDLEELRRLAEAATPGPWRAEHDGYDGDVYGPPDQYGGSTYIAVDREGLGGCVRSPADAAYIAAANPSVMLRLLDLLQDKAVSR